MDHNPQKWTPTLTSETLDIKRYKQTKNKRLSAARKDKRKYIGGRNRRKINYSNNRFEKTSPKQRQMKFFDYDCDFIDKFISKKTKTNYVIFDYFTKIGNDKGVVDKTDKFHHDLKYLLSLKPDNLLGEEVHIKYFNDASCQFKGTLVCISNSGQYKLANITYCGTEMYKKTHLHLITDSYWFHMNCTKNIYINYVDHENYGNDVTKLIKDVIKLKMIKYFLFISSLSMGINDDYAVSPLKYLYMGDCVSTIMNINDCDIKNCSFGIETVKKFVYGKKQRDFAYLQRRNYSKINPMPTYLRHKQFIDIICSYKDLLIEYILDTNKDEQQEEKYNEYDEYVEQQNNQNKPRYLDWDSQQIANYSKLTRKENRTV